MTAFDYARLVETANRLIARYGQDGFVQRPGVPTGPSYDPIPGVPVDHDARFAVISFSKEEIDGTRILSTDKKVLMAPGTLTIDPEHTDKLLEADGTPWNIIDPVETIRPATTTLLYILQVRR